MLIAEIHRTVAVALGGQCTQALGCQKFTRHHIKHVLTLFSAQRAVFEADGNCHIGPYRRVGIVAVDIVVHVAPFVEKFGGEGAVHQCSGIAPALTPFGIGVVIGRYCKSIAQCVIPQRIEFHKVSGTGIYGTAIDHAVHPRHGSIGAISGHHAVCVIEV